MKLAAAYKDKATQLWMVQIQPCAELKIRGGKMGPWHTKKNATEWAARFNEIHTPGFAAGDEVKFYVGDDLSVSYGTVVTASKDSCQIRVNGYEQDLVYTVKKDRLNFN